MMLHNTELPLPAFLHQNVFLITLVIYASAGKWWNYYVVVHKYSNDGREEKGVNRNKLHLFGHKAVYPLS